MATVPPAQQGPQMTLTYVDLPEIAETFADSLERILVDQSGLRMEFVVNRMDDPKPPAPPTGKKYTACRVVMPLNGFMDMVGKLNGIVQALQKQGVIRPILPGSTSGRAN